jgi:hypothetical protein
MRQSLAASIRATADGPVLAREPITDSDLIDLRAELWRDRFLRRGLPEIAFDALVTRVSPVVIDDARPQCAGFVLEAVAPSGTRARKTFSLLSLASVGSRAAHRLHATGALSDVSRFRFALEAVSSPAPPGAPPPGPALQAPPLNWLRVPFRPLVRAAAAVEMEHSEEAFPVFFTEESLALAERLSRRGSAVDPSAESGVVLCGSLAACPDSGEFFCIVTGVIEPRDLTQSRSSLSFGGAAWYSISAAMRARQAAAPERCERLLGQAHGHNFLPADGKQCAECDQLAVCSVDNVYTSTDDEQWMRCCFRCQPWQLCLIFGRNVRGDGLRGLFSSDDGRLQRRGYFVLPSFSSDDWEPISAASG